MKNANMGSTESMRRAKLAWPDSALMTLAGIAVVIYCLALLIHSINWPFTDDHVATLGFLMRWLEAQTWTDKLNALLAPHNEHRLILNHLIELADVAVFGQINFTHMVVVGNMFWALAICMLIHAGRLAGQRGVDLVPTVLLGTTLSPHDLMVWGMGSLQQYGQILCCLLALRAASLGHLCWSLIAALTAAGAGGGGFAVFPALALCWVSRRAWQQMALTLLVWALLLVVHVESLPENMNGTNRITTLLSHPLDAVAYALCFIGSVGKSTQVALVLGALQLIAAGFWLLRVDALRRQPFFVSVVVWILTSAAFAAASRLDLGVDQARSTRYTPHSIVSLSAVGMLALSLASTNLQRQRWRWVSLTVSFLLWVTWLGHGWHQQSRQHDALMRREHIAPPSKAEADRLLQAAQRLGVFDPRP
jgi:hypothetical protein